MAAFPACGPRTPEGREALHMAKGKSYLEKKQLKLSLIHIYSTGQLQFPAGGGAID